MSQPPVLPYAPIHAARSGFVPVRHLHYHLLQWGHASLATPGRPPLVMVHGWMDVGASFQFVVDALAQAEGFERWVIAPDWRGFGHTQAPQADSYWFPDYLGDLDALLDALSPDQPVDLVGHSMGGNVVMSYAGVRPERIRRLVNLEGFGLPATKPHQSPRRLKQWLDELKTEPQLRDYDSVQAVAERLMKNNPLLSADKAAWLARTRQFPPCLSHQPPRQPKPSGSPTGPFSPGCLAAGRSKTAARRDTPFASQRQGC